MSLTPTLEKSIGRLIGMMIDPTAPVQPHQRLTPTPSSGNLIAVSQARANYRRTQSEGQSRSQENVVATLRTLLQHADLIDSAPGNGDATWAVTKPILKHYLTKDPSHLTDYLQLVSSLPHIVVRVVILMNTRLDIRRDADPYSSYTPLGHAIISDDIKLVKTLLKYAADPDMTPCIPVEREATDISSPVHLALRQHCKPEIVNVLLRYGERTQQMDNDYRKSAMSYVARCCDIECVIALLGQLNDVNRTDDDHHTMLHRAALLGNLVVVKELVARKADVNKTDQSLKTSLMCAAEVNAEDIVKFLVAHGADVNKTDGFGRSALHFAVRKGTIAAVGCLLAAGADPMTKDNRDLSPLHYAYVDSKILERSHPKEDEAALLESIINAYPAGQTYCTDQEFIQIAEILAKMSESSDIIVKFMKDNVSRISAKNDVGTTAMHYASHFNKPEVVRWLIQHGADITVANKEGWQAIHFAAMSGSVTTVTDILGKDPKVLNSATCDGWTPVWVALRNGHQTLGDLFIKKGCDVSKTMRVRELIQFESGYSLPLELHDPIQMQKDQIKYAKSASRSITLAEFATSIGFHDTAGLISKK